MTQALGLFVRTLHAASGLLLFGTLVCLLLAGRTAPRPWMARWGGIALLLAALAFLASLGVLALQAASLPAVDSMPGTVARLLTETRSGAIWLLRAALLAATALVLGLSPRHHSRGRLFAALALSGALLAAGPWAGHAAALEPAWPAAAAQALHALAIGAWWGALPALAALLLARETEAASALSRFSRLALPLMGVIIATGGALAWVHVERWPALLATRYGALLLAKLALLTTVLWMAARLRWRMLPALAAADPACRAPQVARWVAIECALAGAIVAAAAQLTQTVPARHDAIAWWLPLRLSVEATWDTPWVREKAAAAAALAIAGLALIGRGAIRPAERVRAYSIGAVVLLAGTALALEALSVDAYPDTYRRPSVPYQTISVAQGAALFAEHCTGCHGRTARGDGELGRTLPVRPADLTEPHTALHTAGDLFWWLTHGKPPGVMPGFDDRLSEDERWDLINFLRTLSSGYQARILTDRAVRGRPWLPAIDFNYTTLDGASGTLKDFRERSAVLLVFFTLPGSAARMRALALELDPLRRAGAAVLAIQTTGEPTDGLGVPTVAEGASETAISYALLRRTLDQPDSRDEHPIPDHMELLVDRFGYVRARWRPGQGTGWEDVARLIEQIEALAREPQVRAAPDDHVH
jgi:putative copper resistance protein D